MNEEPPHQRELEQYYQEYYKPLLRYARRLVHDHHVAEEIVQESYMRLHIALEHEHIQEVKPWLYVVTRNSAMDYFRMKRREPISLSPSSTASCAAVEHDADDDVEVWREYLPHLQRAMDAIPAERAALLKEHYFSGMPYQDLAAQRGKRAEAVKVAAFRARRSLKMMLESMLDKEERNRLQSRSSR